MLIHTSEPNGKGKILKSGMLMLRVSMAPGMAPRCGLIGPKAQPFS